MAWSADSGRVQLSPQLFHVGHLFLLELVVLLGLDGDCLLVSCDLCGQSLAFRCLGAGLVPWESSQALLLLVEL